ncbi:MAG: L-seryl-tRNA(Ser) seleniumtransferase [Pseudonocardiales bacterium]|nr:L-seryl-tRNA(Ser) seleniumtransferase [Pseudonocardiales bacterium]
MTTAVQGKTGDMPYAAGSILRGTADHVAKLSEAWRVIRERHARGLPLHNVSGLERGLHLPDDLSPWVLDDEWAGALYGEQVLALGLEHLGGEDGVHDIAVTNRLTAAIYAAMQVTVRPGSTVIGMSPSYSHPCVRRAVRDAGGRLVEVVGLAAFRAALDREPDVSVVALTRLAVTYEAMAEADIREVVRLAHGRGALVVLDDAGGARVGPALLGQSRCLQLGVDLGATGLDKYGVLGPRVGLLGGRADLLAAARARSFELGSECRPVLYPAIVETLRGYSDQRVRDLVASTKKTGEVLRARLGDIVENTPFIFKLTGEAIGAELNRRSGGASASLAPIEATATLAAVLLKDHGLLTVHFAGLPPGTSALLIKFISARTMESVGGAEHFADMVDEALTRAGAISTDLSAVRALLLGEATRDAPAETPTARTAEPIGS